MKNIKYLLLVHGAFCLVITFNDAITGRTNFEILWGLMSIIAFMSAMFIRIQELIEKQK